MTGTTNPLLTGPVVVGNSFTHTGTPTSGNGAAGWTNQGAISPTPNTIGHGTSWRTIDYADLSAHSGK